MKPILIILPSKGRPEKIEEFYNTWRKTTNKLSDLLVCLDDDDPDLRKYKKHKDIIFDIDQGKSFGDACRRAFKKFPNYKYYYMVADDTRLRSGNWEKRFMEKIEENSGKGVCFGDDLMLGSKMGTSVFISGNIFRAIGYILPKGLIHMYTDVFWNELGKQIDKIYYFPDVIAEHMHFSVGKSEVDSIYLSVDNKIVYNHDKKIFNDWKKNDMKKDIEKIKKYKGF
jgi:hypothetical protein